MSFTFKTAEEKALIYEAAIDALVSGGMKSYSLPTGINVTKLDLPELERLYSYYKKQAYRGKYGITTIADYSK